MNTWKMIFGLIELADELINEAADEYEPQSYQLAVAEGQVGFAMLLISKRELTRRLAQAPAQAAPTQLILGRSR